MKRALFLLGLASLANGRVEARPMKPLTDVILEMCEFATARQRTPSEAAHRFGMHVVDEGSGDITFSPRDRRFRDGAVGRDPESHRLKFFDLGIDNHAELTLGMLRAAFGNFVGPPDVGEHMGDPISFTFDVDPHPDRGVDCAINADAIGEPSVTNPADATRVSRISIVVGPRMGKPKPPK